MPPDNSATEVFAKVKSSFHEQIDLEALRPDLDSLVQSGETLKAIEKLKDWITGNPLDEKAFLLLGELYEQAENNNATVVAFQRALELKEISASYEPSPSLRRYQELQTRAAKDPAKQISCVFDLKTHQLNKPIGMI
jgi:DNA-binding SARP family transcriptional activator